MGESAGRMKPVIILPKDTVSRGDIRELRRNGICVVEAADPSLVRFIDPPPAGYTAQERAAIELFRRVWDRGINVSWTRHDFASLFTSILIEGSRMETPPPPPKVKK